MTRLRAILARGLEATANAWPAIREAFGWIHRLASALGSERPAAEASEAFDQQIKELARDPISHDPLSAELAHFQKVTRSYRPGLFHWREVPGLPRTNNDLEQLFGSYRYHERRCSGRKVASPGLVVRGPVRLVAATATRLRPIEPTDLIPSTILTWRHLRHKLDARRALRTQGRRFRKDPQGFLKTIENVIIN